MFLSIWVCVYAYVWVYAQTPLLSKPLLLADFKKAGKSHCMYAHVCSKVTVCTLMCVLILWLSASPTPLSLCPSQSASKQREEPGLARVNLGCHLDWIWLNQHVSSGYACEGNSWLTGAGRHALSVDGRKNTFLLTAWASSSTMFPCCCTVAFFRFLTSRRAAALP